MSLKIRLQDIGSYQPAVDAKSSDQILVLDGRNYLFDSKGPKSGFSTEVLTPFPFWAPQDLQGIRIQGRTLVFTQDAILSWRGVVPFTWEILYNFDTALPKNQQSPWQAMFMNGKMYLAQEGRGFFSSPVESNTLKLTLTPQTALTIPGLIPSVKGLDKVRGRAIIINDTTIQWSAVSDLTTLAPSLGGPGFQAISNFVKGTFLALSCFQDAFIVWTTEGAVLATFIDGDSVWRFDPFSSSEKPLDQWCNVILSNGNVVIMTNHGLQLLQNGGKPTDWTPDFNEFLRDYLKDQVAGSSTWRLDYDSNRQLIFLSESTDGSIYWRTFVLSPTLNKWGILSDSIYGSLALTNDYYGYAGIDKVPVYFKESYSRGAEPDNARGLSRLFPRVQKQLVTSSSSAVSRAISYDPTIEYGLSEIPTAGWYLPTSLYQQPYGRKGMDSWIQVGFVKPTERYYPVGQAYNMDSGTLLEINEVVVGGPRSAAPVPMDFTTSWKADFFYGEANEDWDSVPAVTHHDFIEDLMTSTLGNIDFLTYFDGHNLDRLTQDFPTYVFSDDGDEDWNTDSGAEDWGGPISGLPILNYGFTVYSTNDGITLDPYTPMLARFNTGSRIFATMTSGNMHVFRFDAATYGEYYHLLNVEATFNVGGKLI